MAKGFVLALAGVLALGVLATSASGGKRTSETSVTIQNPSTGTYQGKVDSSPFGKCRKKREMTVYHDENGNGVDSSDFVIAEGFKTDKRGKWKVTGEEQAPSGDRVIAVAAEKERPKVICKEGSGSTIATG